MTRTVFWLLAAATAISLCSGARAKDEVHGKRRRWRVMVIVPETHLARPRIPDPAAETMFCKKLIDAGYKVIDPQRYAALRYNDVVEQIVHRKPGWQEGVRKLGARFGADVLITGSAFTQEVSNEAVQTEAGRANQIRCRCRIELKGVLANSAEMFYSDSIQKTGPGDLTVELSSKACLEAGAEEMSEAQIEQLDKRLLGSRGPGDSVAPQPIEVHLRALPASFVDRVETALRQVQGASGITPGDYDRGDYSAELSVQRGVTPTRLAARIVAAPALKALKLRLISSNSTRIILASGK